MDLKLIDARLAYDYLKHFIRQGWHVLEPREALWNWHIDVVATELQKTLTHKGPQNLLINIPPGTAKSLIVNVFAPAWMWLHDPTWRAIFAAGSEPIAVRDSMKCRQLIRSDWYQQTFTPRWKLAEDQDAKKLYNTTQGGFRQAISVGADVIGMRADALFIDDPIDADDAPSKVKRDAVLHWYDQAYANRVNDPATSTRVVIMQRLHEEDLAGHLLRGGGFSHICLPMEYDPDHPYVYPDDPRKIPGDLLFPARFPREVLTQELRRFGSLGYAGQMQQRPTPAGGGMLKPEWFRFYRRDVNDPSVQWRPKGCSDAPSIVLPEKFDWLATSWDAAFKGGATNDFVAGGYWAGKGSARFFLHRYHNRVGFVGTVAAIKEFSKIKEGGKPVREHLIEEKANGAAIIEVLKDEITGIIAVNPEGGKEARAAAISPQVESGAVYLPDGAPWLDEFLAEVAAFPRSPHDDEVDQMTQLLLRKADSHTSFAVKFAATFNENPGALAPRMAQMRAQIRAGLAKKAEKKEKQHGPMKGIDF